MRMRRDQAPGRRRAGFTLIELLVVMAIIAVLVSLTAGGIFRIIEGQKKTNTEQALRELDNGLKQQWQEVVRMASKEQVPAGILSLAGGDPGRAQVIWVKLRLNQEFPMTFAEALAPAGGLPSKYATDLRRLGITKGNTVANTQPYESSVCLLLALSHTRAGHKFNPDIVSNVTSIQTYNDPANGQIKVPVFLDAWGTPFAYYRWPTGCQELDGSNPAPAGSRASKNRDPLDPAGLLTTPSWWQAPPNNRPQFEQWCHTVSGSNGPQSYYMYPVIASAGPNGRLGMDIRQGPGNTANMTITNTNDESDNLYSFRLRLNARGD